MTAESTTPTEATEVSPADAVRKSEAEVDATLQAVQEALSDDTGESARTDSIDETNTEARAVDGEISEETAQSPAADPEDSATDATDAATSADADKGPDLGADDAIADSQQGSADEVTAETGEAGIAADTDAADEVSDTEQELAKPSIVKQLIDSAKNNVKTIGACAGSLGMGAGLMFLVGGRTPPEPVVENIQPTPVYVASLARRNEPIAPVVPFEGLQPEIVLLGERLFHDSGLSGNGKVSCASCHDINDGGDDGRDMPIGIGGIPGNMNTPGVLTAALNHTQFWDGRAASLEEQVDTPLTSPQEMNSDWPRVLKYLQNNQRYNTAFVQHMGGEPNEEMVRTALATYQRALLTVGSPFDQWLQGDETALSSDAYAGYHLFKKLNCINCHNGENVGGHIFEPLGKKKDYYTEQRPASERDYGRFNLTGNEQDKHVFRVPTLRNIELTAPYLHDGSVQSLHEAVELMIEYQVGHDANQEDIRRIVLFLESLTAPVPDMPTVPKKADMNAG